MPNETFSITLYNYIGENNRVVKNETELVGVNNYEYIYLKNELTLTGSLRDACSVLSPVILLEYNNNFMFNYCYIPQFERYYYVENIVAVRNKIWEIHLNVDVLMSFQEEILEQECFVTRQEFEVNPNIPDSELPCTNEPQVIRITSHTQSDFLFFNNMSDITVCYALNVVGPAGYIDESQMGTHPQRYYYDRKNVTKFTNMYNTYVLGLDSITNIIKTIVDPNFIEKLGSLFVDKSQNIGQIFLYPFDIAITEPMLIGNHYEYKDTHTILAGSSGELIANGEYCYLVNSRKPYKVFGGRIMLMRSDVTFGNQNLEFLCQEPYLNIALYIPFVGYVNLNTKFAYYNLELNYYVDLSSGVATYVITDVPSDTIILSGDCQLGIEIPINRGDSREIFKNAVSLAINSASSLLTLGFSNAAYKSTRAITRANATRGVSKSSARHQRQLMDIDAKYKKEVGITNTVSEFLLDYAHSASQFSVNSSSSSVWNVNHNDFAEGNYNNMHMLMYRVRTPCTDIAYYNKYKHLIGSPSSYVGKIKDLRGFTKIGGMHLENISNATDDEKEEIDSILRSGFMMPINEPNSPIEDNGPVIST